MVISVNLGDVAPDLVASGALHAWTVVAVGTMTSAVMTRASLGHTGQALAAFSSTNLIYAAIVVAAAARLLAAFDIWREAALTISATAWVLAFRSFALSFGPLLANRPQG